MSVLYNPMIIDDRGELDLTKQIEVKEQKIESLLKESCFDNLNIHKE